MEPIPLNNITMGFSFERFKEARYEYEQIKKAEEERKKKERAFNKKVKPFRDEIKKLKETEFQKLQSNKKFLKRYNLAKEKGWLVNNYTEYVPNGGCGYTETDLLYEFGSTEYKTKLNELIDLISNIYKKNI